MKLPDKWSKRLKGMGTGAIIFFTIKGIITTSLIVGGAMFGFKGC